MIMKYLCIVITVITITDAIASSKDEKAAKIKGVAVSQQERPSKKLRIHAQSTEGIAQMERQPDISTESEINLAGARTTSSSQVQGPRRSRKRAREEVIDLTEEQQNKEAVCADVECPNPEKEQEFQEYEAKKIKEINEFLEKEKKDFKSFFEKDYKSAELYNKAKEKIFEEFYVSGSELPKSRILHMEILAKYILTHDDKDILSTLRNESLLSKNINLRLPGFGSKRLINIALEANKGYDVIKYLVDHNAIRNLIYESSLDEQIIFDRDLIALFDEAKKIKNQKIFELIYGNYNKYIQYR